MALADGLNKDVGTFFDILYVERLDFPLPYIEHPVILFLKQHLPYDFKVIGSAKKWQAFINGHDFDILIHTNNNKQQVINDLMSLNWQYPIPLHVFVYGKFYLETIKTPNIIQIDFAHPFLKPFIYFKTKIYKWKSKQ